MSDIRFVGDMERLQIKEGDKFVLKVPHQISSETAEKIQKIWADFSEGKCGKLLILDKDMELGVISTVPEKE